MHKSSNFGAGQRKLASASVCGKVDLCRLSEMKLVCYGATFVG